ncbi:biopolymer transporter ExbD [Verrucomicrobiaceae bacterium R5-34]|uniref:Biopolymer transporter ExbD n=1 Tax=Oceaniferula flava TaxID=2800421 RepID=A0AAE2VDX2_9BACT|nr:biopolymer transporter ExbD [Oceaniferula flavus]MBK1829759.1 biopolymer transporter ExbD [Verrucomicrobiaceae bacterium R5-34]MBK1856436.1 biopolymer transporter ExbD [Oceaniferula flavus]MBM1137743.1 biopolymer transporter ExbD [Oceaniferula flavus]
MPIIPLIDILAILLIYFAVEFDPKTKRPVMNIELALVQDSKTTTEVVEPAAVLAISAEGMITLDATRIPDEMLVDYLKVFREKFPSRKLELEPDKGLQLEGFIKIQNALIAAGINPKDVPSRVKLPESTIDTQ